MTWDGFSSIEDALKTLDFIPIQSANYSGGVLVTDWYSNSLDSNSSIKIEVRFKSTELSPSSIDVLSYKRTCKNMIVLQLN